MPAKAYLKEEAMAKRVLSLLIPLFLVMGMASALPNDPYDPDSGGDPLNVYEIYNILYGTDFESSEDLPTVDPDDVFEGCYDIEVQARYAGAPETGFGYYQPTGATGGEVELLTTTGVIDPEDDGPTASVNLDDPFGFYIEIKPAGRFWYSESGLNSDLFDHMILFSTPDPQVFLMAWEDKPVDNSDLDYNDLVLEITRCVIPEPTSMVLVGLGLAGMAARRFRRIFS
jgi:hypothetical protein